MSCLLLPTGNVSYGRHEMRCTECGQTTYCRDPSRCHMQCQAELPETPAEGPGTELKKLLRLLGLVATEQCRCNARAALMNRQGCDWCQENLETIVGWLREEAHERGLPFSGLAARQIVKLAIRRARRHASG